MAFSLYAATVPSYRQILGSVADLIDKAQAFCAEKGILPQDIIQARLADDMQPFAYQVKSTVVHSLGAIEGIRKGVFSPDMTPPPQEFAALKARIVETLAALETVDAGEIFWGRRAKRANLRVSRYAGRKPAWERSSQGGLPMSQPGQALPQATSRPRAWHGSLLHE